MTEDSRQRHVKFRSKASNIQIL